MAKIIGRTRASVEARETPASNGAIVEALGADAEVEVIEVQNGWLKIKPIGLRGAVEGYVPELAIALPPTGEPGVFPTLDLPGAEGQAPPSVPRWLKAQELAGWLAAPGAKPGWISDNLWEDLGAAGQNTLANDILSAVQARQGEWDSWWAEIGQNGRQDEATLDEWLIILEGGRNAWAIRPERIFKGASTKEGHVGWLGENDILLWTGHVRRNDAETKYKTWHEVRLYKYRRSLGGWFKADLLEEYIFPSEENDPSINKNAEKVFDLSIPMLRIPADPEFDEALAAGARGAQYLLIKEITGRNRRNYNLCGEICVAALAGVNVVPLLKQWSDSSSRAKKILEKDHGTGLQDLLSMLALYGRTGEMFQYSASVSPVSPRWIKDQLRTDKKAIVGVGIKRSGRLAADGYIRHWVVLEDVLPVGHGGWVRLYNPFMNRDEVYTYDVFRASMGQFGIGLWIDHVSPQE
jgi:hypothetical protein